MNRLLALFAVLFFASCAAKGQGTSTVTTNDTVRLRVTVLDVVPLRNFSGSLTPTGDIDPRFALTVRIDSCVPALTNLKPGTAETFAVRSPTLFLRGSTEKGKSYEIEMSRKKAMNLVSKLD